MTKNNKYDNYTKEELVVELEALKKKKYGLVWDRKNSQEYLDAFVNWENLPENFIPNKFPVLKELKNREIYLGSNHPLNFLIEGDNYHSLAVLNFTHRKAFDMVYIDPPYNTGGSEFIYNDKIVEKEDPYRHSKWLSFIEKRLTLVKNLLKDDGVIFISIDDHEQAQLRLLCDEIFGEGNFIEQLCWKNKYGAGAQTKGFISVHEYILCYGKHPEIVLSGPLTESEIKKYNKKDSKFPLRGGYVTQPLATRSLGDRPNLVYPVEYKGKKIWPDKQWVWSRERMLQAIKNDEVVITKVGGKYSVRSKQYLKDDNGKLRQGKPLSWLEGPYTQDGTADLENVFHKKIFNFPKPVALIKYLLSLTINERDNRNYKILDFFAGSGTTGHAVLQLNKDDGGNRSFILCTNNRDEDNDHKICTDICYPRLEKITKGYQNLDKKKVKGTGGNLKYYKTDFVEAAPTDRNKRKLVNESTEMLCLKEDIFESVIDETNFKIFRNNKKFLGIIFNEEAVADFKKEGSKLKGEFIIYCFSYLGVAPEKEFFDFNNKHKVKPIPEVILRVYREIFSK